MKTHDERMHELLYSNEGRVEQCERIITLEDDLAFEQALNNSLINFDVVETKTLNDAQKEYIKQQKERICRLEELVQDMWRFTGTACKKYPRLFDPSAQGPQVVLPNMLDDFEQRMRELGIEVE